MPDKILTDSGVSRLSTNAKNYVNKRIAGVTQSEYDALPIATKTNGTVYLIEEDSQKTTVIVPTVTSTLTYNGSSQSPTFDSNYDSTIMNVSGNTGTNAGTYTATFSLIDTSAYEWSDEPVVL